MIGCGRASDPAQNPSIVSCELVSVRSGNMDLCHLGPHPDRTPSSTQRLFRASLHGSMLQFGVGQSRGSRIQEAA
jgi:hypothetical protein